MGRVGEGFGYRIGSDSLEVSIVKTQKNPLKKEDTMAESLRSNLGKLNQIGGRFRRGIIAVLLWKPPGGGKGTGGARFLKSIRTF